MTHKTRPTGRVSTLIEGRSRLSDRQAIGWPVQAALDESKRHQAQWPARQAQTA